MSYKFRLAVDFDNTIVAYDALFVAAARARKLIADDFSGAKQALRDELRRQPNGELEWQALQAEVYGELIGHAVPFPGVHEFIGRARALGGRIAVVSHKTMFAAARPDGVNLRSAARAWLRANDFLSDDRIVAADVYFEPTRQRKLERIRSLGAAIVIDDLVEVLSDPGFPPAARRWLFAPDGQSAACEGIECFATWQAMREALDR